MWLEITEDLIARQPPEAQAILRLLLAQIAAGSRFVETLLTVVTTCRRQDRPVLAYLTSAVTVHFHGQPTPSLLPGA